MKKDSKSIFVGLLVAMFIGFVLGLVLWVTGVGDASALWLTPGFALSYLHIRWVINVNKIESDTKLKRFV